MREIERLPRQIMIPFEDMKFEQIFSLRCHTEQAESQKARRKLKRMTFSQPAPSLLDTLSSGEEPTILRIALRQSCGLREVVEPDGIEPTTSCLQSRRSPS